MARARAFDPEVALAAAMDLFWTKGYDETSLDDLVAHTGVARAGLYSAFGDKRALYLKALERYVTERDLASAQLFRDAPSGLAAVRALLERYAADASGRDRRGCLIVNSTIQLAATDADIERLVSRSWNAISSSLTDALIRAQHDGEISADRDPGALAHMVLVVLQGLRVLARTKPRRTFITDTVEQTMASLTR